MIFGRDNKTGGPIFMQEHLSGGPGADVIYGGPGRDRIQGGGNNEPGGMCIGSNSVPEEGFAGPDVLYAGDGDDLVCGSNGNDRLFGDAGLDSLVGGRGNDRLFGGPGDDVLVGGPGNDFIDNNEGDDSVDCGPGIDRVVVDVYDETCELFTVSTNGPPIAGDAVVFVRTGASVVFKVAWNDYDEGDVASFVGHTAPANGVATCQPGSPPNDGNSASCTYTPRAGFVGNDRFEYTVRDRRGETGTGVAFISVRS